MALGTLRIKKLAWLSTHPSAWPDLRNSGTVPAVEHIGLIRRTAPDLVLDAGANRGQFSLAVRRATRGAQIIAFEPLDSAADLLAETFRDDDRFTLRRVALGAELATAEMQVTASDDSSSLLQVGSTQIDLFPTSRVVDTQEVSVTTLDEELADVQLLNRTMLKIDVQGGEFALLKGARKSLQAIRHIYVELSFVDLYVGQSLASEVVAWLAEEGFELVDVENLTRARQREAVQADFLFERTTKETK